MYPLLGPISDPRWRLVVIGLVVMIVPFHAVVFVIGVRRYGIVDTLFGAPLFFVFLFELGIQTLRFSHPVFIRLWRDNKPRVHINAPLPRRTLGTVIGVAFVIAFVGAMVGIPLIPVFFGLFLALYLAARHRLKQLTEGNAA